MTETRTVAVLGTGIMGAAMARNLARSGHAVRAWNRTIAKAAPLADEGVTVATTPAEAVRGADVLLTILYDGESALAAVREAVPGLRPGMSWVQSTTAGLEQITELAGFAAGHGLVLFDAPVLGTRAPAEAGQLTVLAAGPQEQREVVRPVFDAIGAKTVWIGDDAAQAGATRLKLVTNSWVLAATHGAAEALALAKGLGVDPADFFSAVAGGPLDMGYLHAKTDLVLHDRLTPASFAVTTAEKDARLIVRAGELHGVRMDVAAAGAERMRRAAEQGYGDADMAASYYASWPAPPR